MSNLQNLTPANTYKGLLQVGDYTNGVDSTVKAVLDGEGTTSALAIGTTKVGINTTSPTQELDVSGNVVADEYALDQTGTSSSAVAIHAPATNELAIRTNSTEAMRIDSNGNCGIGTASPSEVLDVVGSVEVADGTLKLNTSDRAVDRTIEYTNAGSSTALCAIDFGTSGTNNYLGHISLKTKGTGDAFDDSLTEAMRITSDGKVGIGTASPKQLLHLEGQAPRLRLQDSSPIADGIWDIINNSSVFTIQHREADDTDISNHFHILPNGNVGINTASPDAKMDIKDGHILVKQSTNTTQENILLQGSGYELNGSLYGNVSIRSNYDNATNAGSLNFYSASSSTNTTERMRIDSEGNVGIGTASPDAKLHLSTAGTDGLRLGVDSQTYYHTIRPNGDGLYLGADDGDTGGSGADIRLNVKGDEKMRIDSDGKVGIGTVSPSAPLEVSSTTGGVIMPRMTTTQMIAISSPTDGEMIYNTTANKFYGRANGAWTPLH